jgi:oligopeptide/dipeptide ABC transporter ATP-binding protein
MEPEFLVLDEPVSNLDVSIQAQIINLFLDIKQKLSLTYLFISHDLNLVAYLSDRVGVMYRGRIVEMGLTEQIMDNPAHPYTQNLFASSPTYGRDLPQGGPAVAAVAPVAETGPDTCPYAGRCGWADRSCLGREPELRDIGGGHLVACLKPAAEEGPEHDNPGLAGSNSEKPFWRRRP